MTVLVAYASEHGSTREIAARLAARLDTAFGTGTVVLRAVDEVPDVSGYDAVVIGSAVHRGAWLPSAVRFVERRHAALTGQPLWCFSVGMPAALPRRLRGPAAARERELALAPIRSLVGPREVQLFSGVVRPEHFPARSRLVMRLMGAHFGDFRDWPAIDAWADRIAVELAATSTPPPAG